MVWARHEDGRRSRSEESDDESDTGEKEESRGFKTSRRPAQLTAYWNVCAGYFGRVISH